VISCLDAVAAISSRPGGIYLMRVQTTLLRLSTLCLVFLMGMIAVYECGSSTQETQAPVRSPGSVTCYIDSSTGNDANPGTSPEQAWRSLERVNSKVFASGDRILLRAGSSFPGRLSPQGSAASTCRSLCEV